MDTHTPAEPEFNSPEEAAAYDKWFRKKVARSLADPSPPIPHEQVKREIREIIENARRRQAAE